MRSTAFDPGLRSTFLAHPNTEYEFNHMVKDENLPRLNFIVILKLTNKNIVISHVRAFKTLFVVFSLNRNVFLNK